MLTVFRAHNLKKNFQVFSRSVNFRTRNPPEPHFDRKRMLEVCKPIYIPEVQPDYFTCAKNKLVVEEKPHPYDVIISKELKDNINSSKMMLVYHVNAVSNEEKTTIYRFFFKENMQFCMYNINVLKLGFDDMKYQALMKLFESSNGLVFSPEISLNKALRLSKKFENKILLLAGIVDDRFYSKTQLNEINQIFRRNIHDEMVSHVQAPGASILRSLKHQMNLLSHNLKQISKGEEK